MKKCVSVVLLGVLLMPAPAHAWGFEAHKFIVDRAIALLPDAIRPMFEKHRATLRERSIDPDTWRTAGFAEESPNHYLDIDWQGFGKYPFKELPRDYSAAVAKFGVSRIDEMGRVPWRIDEMFGNLRRAFESYGKGSGFAQNDVVFFSAWLAHYASDAHVPFHAVENHDGQLTRQNGIHARFESTMFERYRDQLTVAPRAMAPITNPRDFAFSTVIEGSQLVPAILKSDLAAIGTRDVYDDAYYASFFQGTRAVLERRLNESIAAVAALVTGAWEAAGKPPAPVNPPKAPPRRR